MLIEKSTKSDVKSKYICDSCGIEMTPKDRVPIHRGFRNTTTKKKYDLCKDCWKKVRWIIEKHKLKKGE
jgi:hypothetical protein